MIQVWFRTYRLRKALDAIVILVMTYDILDLVIIFVNYMRSNQVIQSTFLFESLISRLWKYHNLNDVIHVNFRDVVSRMINSQYMSMRQISLLKLNDINMSFRLSQHMSLCKISNQLFKFQLKHSSTKIKAILNRYFKEQITSELRSIKITRKCNEKIKLFKLAYQCQSILLFNLHKSRRIDVIEEQNDNFLLYIFELTFVIQSIHDTHVEINS